MFCHGAGAWDGFESRARLQIRVQICAAQRRPGEMSAQRNLGTSLQLEECMAGAAGHPRQEPAPGGRYRPAGGADTLILHMPP